MFGTIATFRPKPGDEAGFRSWAAGEGAERTRSIDGFLTTYLLEPSDPDGDWMLFVAFTDEASYRKNAADPAQHEDYLRLLAQVDAPPVWHDGTLRLLEASSVAI